jgi:hypothetical protein
MRIGVRERLQQDVINDAEDGGSGADSESQRGHSEHGDAAIADKAPDCRAEVAPNEAHAKEYAITGPAVPRKAE